MNEFTYLQTRHEHLKKKVEEGENTVIYVFADPGTNALVAESNDYRSQNVRAEIRSLIMDVRQLSGSTMDPFERSILREILAYWNHFELVKTKSFPNHDILPAPEMSQTEKLFFRGMLLAAGTLAAAIVMMVYLFLAARVFMPTPGEPTAQLELPYELGGKLSDDPVTSLLAPALFIFTVVGTVIILALSLYLLNQRLQQAQAAKLAKAQQMNDPFNKVRANNTYHTNRIETPWQLQLIKNKFHPGARRRKRSKALGKHHAGKEVLAQPF